MSGKHTPGPWKVSKEHRASRVVAFIPQPTASLFILVAHDGDCFGGAHEDATLISAAPDLLAACEVSLGELRDLWDDHPVKKQIRAAIARAKGKTK